MICGVDWRAWHGKCYGLVGIAWYMYWPGQVWHCICYCLVEYNMVWSVGHDLVYHIVWRGMARYMVWPCWHGYMVWPGEVWNGIGYGLPGIAWHIVWPSEIWHGI